MVGGGGRGGVNLLKKIGFGFRRLHIGEVPVVKPLGALTHVVGCLKLPEATAVVLGSPGRVPRFFLGRPP